MMLPPSKRPGRRAPKNNPPMRMLHLPLELHLVIGRISASPTAIKNLRCSAKSFRDLIKDEDLLSAYTHHLWDKHKETSLDYLCNISIQNPTGYFNGFQCPHRINPFHNTKNSIPTALVQRLIARGAQQVLNFLFGSPLVNTAVDTNNEPLLNLLIGMGTPAKISLEYLLTTSQTDPHSILLTLSHHYSEDRCLFYKASTLVSVAERGWHATARLLSAHGVNITMMERNDHLQIWLAAIRDGDVKSIKYFTENRPSRSCYGLLTRAIKLKSVIAVKRLLELPAKGKWDCEKCGGIVEVG
ncbi:hypothetical protein HK097_005253 [Rhizophlyctis rosea]|uniref:F-box domain-containing protein n=1 Tax=Rhizophlyctis rosea TaxID=64517 RepID=A0AAD5SFL6_9FUNG|nr:hypothetical protein HK097_005253 [Rhizophlyctis rosea]